MTDLATKVELPLLLTALDIQKHLQVSRSEAYELMSNGELPCVRIGKLVRVPRGALLDFIGQGTGTAT